MKRQDVFMATAGTFSRPLEYISTDDRFIGRAGALGQPPATGLFRIDANGAGGAATRG